MKKHLNNIRTEKFKGSEHSSIRTLANNSGAALIVTLLIIVAILALIPVAIDFTSHEFDRAGSFEENKEAFFVAEAGLEHAKFLVGQSTIRAALMGPDNAINATPTHASNADNGTFGTAATGGTQEILNGLNYDKVTFNGNTYYVRAFDNNDGDNNPMSDNDFLINLTAVGEVDGTTKTVQAQIYYPTFPISAITTNGNLTISGNPDINGTCGSIHANGNLTTTGTTDVTENLTSTGTYTPGGSEIIGGTSGGGQPEIPVPHLDVTDFQPFADFTLQSDGDVFNNAGTRVHNYPGDGQIWNNWKYTPPSPPNPAKWEHENDDTFSASLYIDGDVVVGDSPGTALAPWEITIVATGHINVSGTPIVSNKKNPADPQAIQDLFMIAGTDLSYSGNQTQTIEGLFYATEQIKISGNPTINGAVLALDSPTTVGSGNLVVLNEISGNPDITYGCGLTLPSSGSVQVVSWNEL